MIAVSAGSALRFPAENPLDKEDGNGNLFRNRTIVKAFETEKTQGARND